jgi:putative CocE/NonD family hydrolase
MNVPCFTLGSWFDFMCVGSVESFIGRQHKGGKGSRGHQQLLLGPWLHGASSQETNQVGGLTFPERARFSLLAHKIRWFDHYLKGIDNGVDLDPVVRYYVMVAMDEKDAPGHEWRTAADWPIAATPKSYYLRDGGKLSIQPPADENSSTRFLADPLKPQYDSRHRLPRRPRRPRF